MSEPERNNLWTIDHVVHPRSGEQVAWFETDSCQDHWVMWTYPAPALPDLIQYFCREDAEKVFRETVDSWPVA